MGNEPGHLRPLHPTLQQHLDKSLARLGGYWVKKEKTGVLLELFHFCSNTKSVFNSQGIGDVRAGELSIANKVDVPELERRAAKIRLVELSRPDEDVVTRVVITVVVHRTDVPIELDD